MKRVGGKLFERLRAIKGNADYATFGLKRHHKRRLVDPAWAAAAARALAPGCLLRVASDHEEYFPVIDDVLSKEPLLEKLSPEEAGEWSTGTSYELKFSKAGRSIYRIVFRRR